MLGEPEGWVPRTLEAAIRCDQQWRALFDTRPRHDFHVRWVLNIFAPILLLEDRLRVDTPVMLIYVALVEQLRTEVQSSQQASI